MAWAAGSDGLHSAPFADDLMPRMSGRFGLVGGLWGVTRQWQETPASRSSTKHFRGFVSQSGDRREAASSRKALHGRWDIFRLNAIKLSLAVNDPVGNFVLASQVSVVSQ